VRFAVALLKDRDGNIDLDVPVEGDLDDPKFKIWKIILDVFLSLITKAVMSPFALLGALFGGDTGEHLEVPFAAGSAELTAAQGERLDQLAKGLVEKPALRLEVEDRVSVTADSMALVRERLNQRLIEARDAERRKGAPPDTSKSIAPEDYARLLGKVYADAFGKAPKPVKSSKRGDPAADSVAAAGEARRVREMEQRLLASLPVEPSEVRRLGRRRADRIKETLVRAGPVEPERIFIVIAEERSAPADSGRTADSARVMVGLTLTSD
jgi:hypothetical protein